MVACLVFLIAQDWKIEAKASVLRREKDWTFQVEGTTRLPAGTVLRGRVYALVEDMTTSAKEWDEEALFYGDEAFQDAEVAGGKFALQIYSVRRRPYSLLYRVRLVYDPEFQNDAVKKAVGSGKFHKDVDFREGDDKALGEELRATARELNEEFVLLKELFLELKSEFTAQQKKYDAERWKKWLDPWMDRVQAVRVRNDDRWMLWAVWIERQGRLRIEGLCMRLPDLASDCREVLEGRTEALERAELKMKAYLDTYEEAVEVVGLEMPLDLETIAPALRDYLTQIARLKGGAPKGEVRRAGTAALLKIAGTFERRKKGYYRIHRIMTLFLELLGAPDAAALEKILAEHDREVAEFKAYAGIK